MGVCLCMCIYIYIHIFTFSFIWPLFSIFLRSSDDVSFAATPTPRNRRSVAPPFFFFIYLTYIYDISLSLSLSLSVSEKEREIERGLPQLWSLSLILFCSRGAVCTAATPTPRDCRSVAPYFFFHVFNIYIYDIYLSLFREKDGENERERVRFNPALLLPLIAVEAPPHPLLAIADLSGQTALMAAAAADSAEVYIDIHKDICM